MYPHNYFASFQTNQWTTLTLEPRTSVFELCGCGFVPILMRKLVIHLIVRAYAFIRKRRHARTNWIHTRTTHTLLLALLNRTPAHSRYCRISAKVIDPTIPRRLRPPRPPHSYVMLIRSIPHCHHITAHSHIGPPPPAQSHADDILCAGGARAHFARRCVVAPR